MYFTFYFGLFLFLFSGTNKDVKPEAFLAIFLRTFTGGVGWGGESLIVPTHGTETITVTFSSLPELSAEGPQKIKPMEYALWVLNWLLNARQSMPLLFSVN